jgi:hypothetical protein
MTKYTMVVFNGKHEQFVYLVQTEWSKSLCAPDDYSTKNHAKVF